MVDMEVSYSKANEFKPLTTKTFTTYTSNYFQTSNKYKNTTKNTSINYQNEENDSYDDSYALYDKFSKQGQYEKDSFHYKKLLTSKLLLKKIEILKNSINNLKIKDTLDEEQNENDDENDISNEDMLEDDEKDYEFVEPIDSTNGQSKKTSFYNENQSLTDNFKALFSIESLIDAKLNMLLSFQSAAPKPLKCEMYDTPIKNKIMSQLYEDDFVYQNSVGMEENDFHISNAYEIANYGKKKMMNGLESQKYVE